MSAKSQRAPARNALKKAIEELKIEVVKDVLDKDRINLLWKRIQRHRGNILKLDDKIAEELQKNNATDVEFQTEYEEASNWQDTYEEALQLFAPFLQVGGSEDSIVTVVGSHGGKKQESYKLPRLELKKFGGDPKDWIAFWSQFKTIHENEDITTEEKFQYLIQATKSAARSVVDSFPPSAENYPKVIKYLSSRFGREEILVEVYVRDLLGLVINNIQKKGAFSVSSIYDKLETQLRSLETLGVTSDKYAAMLYPLVESSLPEEVLRAWERSRIHIKKEDNDTDLSCILKFIRSEVESEERIQLAKRGFGSQESKQASKKTQEFPTATDLYSGEGENSKDDNLCIFCDKKHDSASCFQAPKMSVEEKKRKIQEKKACFTCFKRNHISKKCKSKVKCPVCEKRHFVIMCPGLPSQREESGSEKEQTGKDSEKVSTLANQTLDTVLLQTLVVRACNGENEKLVRVLIDMGSQLSYVTVELAKALDLEKLEEVTLGHGLFGGQEIKSVRHGVYKVNTWSWEDKTKSSCPIKLKVLDQEKICGSVTRVPPGPWLEELNSQGIQISDVGHDKPDIHMLIGADVAGELLTGKLVKTRQGPVAIHTKLGWVMMGKCPQNLESQVGSYLSCSFDTSVQNLWKLDVLGIRDPIEVKTEEKMVQEAIQQFQDSVTINGENRYEVGLPFKQGHGPLADNLESSKKRLRNVIRKLEVVGKTEAYQKIFKEWEQMGIIEVVPESEIDVPGFVMPHRPNFNPNSKTTPIRPVFDASARTKGTSSLNDVLLKGPNLIEMIPSILTRFRTKKYAVTSDIRKAFLQISVKEEDRNFLQFLCWEGTEDDIKWKLFRHCRVVFGVSSSPFLLAATLNHHLDSVTGEDASTAKLLKKSFYVDNLLASVDSENDLQELVGKTNKIMMEGKFELRGWAWNSNLKMDSMDESSDVSVLGMSWNTAEDSLRFVTRRISYEVDEPITMRKIAGVAQKIFDPLGICSPVTLIPKLLIQKLWEVKCGWDREVPEDVKKDFRKWIKNLHYVSDIRIPRWIMVEEACNLSLHLFCDGSSYGFGFGIFLRAEMNGVVSVQLIRGKAKVAPKGSTIPRLELLACLVGARCIVEVQQHLEMPDIPIVCWTDSSNALHWIKTSENWSLFVHNRVQEIRKLTNIDNWRHLPGASNPADLPSRGCNGKALLESKWWEGPEWLKLEEDKWPKSKINVDINVILAEKKKSVITAISKVKEEPWFFKKFSSFKKTVSVVARILRWKRLAKKERMPLHLTVSEMDEAERRIWKAVQEFGFEGQSSLFKELHARKDEHGVRRVRSKIIMRNDTEEFRFPILLPCKNPLVKSLIRQIHQDNKHAGINTLLSLLREKYWVIKTRKTIQQVIRSCSRCQRWNARAVEVEEAPLPADRVREAEVFEVVGVDLGGPLYIRKQKKVWFAVFTCAVTRAVHLELVTDLSTESFIMAMRRFIARRGRPKIIYSDNGRNFVGLENLLKELDWEMITKRTGLEKIEWRFNPPAAPWWGGFWERMVGLVKTLLRKNLGKETLSYEELQTLIMEIEDLINKRPLTYVSENVDELIPLTPAALLGKEKSHGTPDLDLVDATAIRRRYGKLEKLREAIMTRFRVEYLGALVHHDKKKMRRTIKVGDVVIMAVDNAKRGSWPLARVLELIAGRDGPSRMAVIKTATGIFKRAVQCLYPMELDISAECVSVLVGA